MPEAKPLSTGQKAVFYVILVLLTGFLLETFSFVVGIYLSQKGFLLGSLSTEGYEGYMAKRHEVLGWPSPSSFGGDERDASGSRIIPAFPDPETPACVSLYGDSFTWGSAVDPEEAWSNVLSLLTDCRVANYGQGGYGSDQAYLRFRHNTFDTAPIVVLGHMSLNISRNVNQYRFLLSGGSSLSFKPRYVLGADGGLELVPLPTFSEEEFAAMTRDPARYLEHDFFVPGGDSGLVRLRFPFTWAVLQARNHIRFRATLQGKSWLADFYQPGHPSGGLEITARILAQFTADARAAGRSPLVILIPNGQDIELFREGAGWLYQPLIDSLASAGIEALNIGAGLDAYLGKRAPKELYNPGIGHFTAEGYERLAMLVYERLESDGVLAAP